MPCDARTDQNNYSDCDRKPLPSAGHRQQRGKKKQQNEMEVPCKQAGLMSHSGPRWKDLCLFVQSKQLNRSVENVMLSKSEFTIDQFLWRC